LNIKLILYETSDGNMAIGGAAVFESLYLNLASRVFYRKRESTDRLYFFS
jgi:hypothetical protein